MSLAGGATTDVGFAPGAIEDGHVQCAADVLGRIHVFADPAFRVVIAEATLNGGTVEPAPGVREQVTHVLALGVEALSPDGSEHLPAAEADAAQVTTARLDHCFFG